MSYSYFAVKTGRESVWIIGDDMVNKTHRQHFLGREKDNLYTSTHFETTVIAGTPSSPVKNLLARIVNCFISRFNTEQRLPKWVVFVIENELIKFLNFNTIPPKDMYKPAIEWMFDQLKSIRSDIREKLPFKAKKYEWPYFLWIEATTHTGYNDNEKRKIFVEHLQDVNSFHPESIVLPLDQGWDSNNSSYFPERERRYTTAGLHTFWSSVDKTIMYADNKVLRHHGKTLLEIFKQDAENFQKSREPPSAQPVTGQNVRRFNTYNRYYNNNRDSRHHYHHHPPSLRRDNYGYRLPPPSRY